MGVVNQEIPEKTESKKLQAGRLEFRIENVRYYGFFLAVVFSLPENCAFEDLVYWKT